MTLIAGLRCEDGAVICADTQETVEIDGRSYRASVQKIKPREIGNFDLSIGGSGVGDLIDAFIARAERKIRQSQATSIADLEALLHSELFDFMQSESMLVPDEHRPMKFIIGGRVRSTGEFQLWETAMSQLIPVSKFKLIGWEEVLYVHMLERHYRDKLPISQAVLLGVRLLGLAESTSNYVRGPMSIVIVGENGMREESAEGVKALEERAASFAGTLDSIMLACADVSMQHDDFQVRLREVENTILQLRADYLEAVALELSKNINDLTRKLPAYPPVPVGSVISIGADKSMEVRVTEELYELKRIISHNEQVTGHVTVRRSR